jgi:hypothetical protein
MRKYFHNGRLNRKGRKKTRRENARIQRSAFAKEGKEYPILGFTHARVLKRNGLRTRKRCEFTIVGWAKSGTKTRSQTELKDLFGNTLEIR